jgi:hypothetical protein
MNSNRSTGCWLALLALLLPAGLALAQQAGGAYLQRKHVLAGGGGDGSGGSFVLRGSVGQHDVGASPNDTAVGGGYRLRGGFWAGRSGGAPPVQRVFRDGFEAIP